MLGTLLVVPGVPAELPTALAPFFEGASEATTPGSASARSHTVANSTPTSAVGSGSAGDGVCAQCGRNGISSPNCCSTGGSWAGTCKHSGGQHTWSEGFQACNGELASLGQPVSSDVARDQRRAPDSRESGASTQRVSLAELSDMFRNGVASNNLSEVGLIFHGFDQPTDAYWAPYKPCTYGVCEEFREYWPGSIINAHQRHTFAPSGLILSPVRGLWWE